MCIGHAPETIATQRNHQHDRIVQGRFQSAKQPRRFVTRPNRDCPSLYELDLKDSGPTRHFLECFATFEMALQLH
jgi:hypothetical protein